MSANTNMASSPLNAASASANSGSAFDRMVRKVKDIKAGDLFINGLWAAFALYGLVATANVFLTY
jgi:hypothetical protein